MSRAGRARADRHLAKGTGHRSGASSRPARRVRKATAAEPPAGLRAGDLNVLGLSEGIPHAASAHVAPPIRASRL
eukprot:8362060-Pyramimonas_sp.AAC.1